MATVNERFRDRAIAHAIDTRMYSNGVVRRMASILSRAEKDLATELTRALERLPADSFTVERLEALIGTVRELNRQMHLQVAGQLQSSIRGLAEVEAPYQTELFRDVVPGIVQVQFPITGIAVEQVYAAAMSRPFQGRLLSGWAAKLEADTLEVVRNTIRLGYVEGQTTQQIVRRLIGTRANRYADGTLQRLRREVTAVVHTALAHTAQVARNEMTAANADILAAVQWVSTLDTRTSPQCRLRDSLKYTIDEHRPIGHRIPWLEGPGRIHWNCIPAGQRVRVPSAIRRAYRRPYKGDLIVIHTAAGRDLACTPKHPILTDRGWVAAEFLDLGDKVIAHLVGNWESVGDAKDDDVPSFIEDVAESFLVSRGVIAVEVPVTAPDFHGDGSGSEIAVVATDWSLCVEGDAALAKDCGDPILIDRGTATASCVVGAGGRVERCVADLSTSGGGVSSRDVRATLIGAHPIHPSELLLGSAADVNAGRLETPTDNICGDVLPFSDGVNSDSIAVHADRARHIEGGDIPATVRSTAGPPQGAVDDATADARLFDDIRNTESGVMESDAVISLSRRSFCGHVYNLETESGWFVAEGIITHNCRSASVPVVKSWRELGLNVDQLPPGTRASMDGQVAADLTFRDWLKRQSAERQDDILGPTRGRLMRSGKLDFPEFYDAQGRWLTLDQLRERNAAAFRRAGL